MVFFPSVPVFVAANVLLGFAQSLAGVTMGPFLMENSGEQERTYLFSFASGMRMTATSIGEWVGGYLPSFFAGVLVVSAVSTDAYKWALGAAIILMALSLIPVLMMSNVRNINWDDPAAAVTGFVTVAFMPLTYNISYGIAFGLISYVFVKIFTGKIKDINVGTWIISILFALMFFLTR